MSELAGKTALVTGATGFLGGALVHRLAADGVHVKALARREGRDRYIRTVDNIEIVMGNIKDADRMIEVTQGCDYVFHVAALIFGRYERQYQTNVEGTRNVARAAAHANVTRLIHVSTIATYGYNHTTNIITEDTSPTKNNIAYNTTKALAENALITVGKQSGLSYTIARPGMIYGPRSGSWTDTVFKLATRQPMIFIGKGDMLVYLIYVDDLLDMLILQATHPAAEGEAFNCVHQPQATAREYVDAFQALAQMVSWVGLPMWLAKSLAPLVDFYLSRRGNPQDVRDLLGMLERNTVFSMDKAKDLLGWQPQVSLKDGMQCTLPYLHEKGLLS